MTSRGLAALGLALLAGCADAPVDEAADHQIRISVAPTPPIVGPVRVVVEVRDAQGREVEEARVTLVGEPARPDAAPVEARLGEEGGGRYSVTDFDLATGGAWVLTAEVVLPDGRRIRRRQEVRVISAAVHSPAPEASPPAFAP